MLITEKRSKSTTSEAYKSLRTNIQYSSADKKIESILVTSADPAEGKSTISSNLALSFAQEDKRVILIDCDLRKPSIHKQFRVSNAIGLSDLLIGKAQFSEVVTQFDERLTILTSGKIPPNPSEMLGSKNMSILSDELKKQYDVIILDSAPLQMVTDAQILSTKVDGTLLVIKARTTKKETVLQSKKLLENVGANILGIVLNGVDEVKGKYNYYYGSENR